MVRRSGNAQEWKDKKGPMKTSNDIERLRTAEHEAQGIVALAKDEARRLRKETEDRVVQIGAETEEDLKAIRDRINGETESACAEIAERSCEDADTIISDVSRRLGENREEAVKRVIEELTRVS